MTELKWEITITEQKSRGKKGLFQIIKTVLYFTGIIFILVTFFPKDCSTTYIQCVREVFPIMLYLLAVPLFIIFCFVVGHIIDIPRIRKYVLSENGITLTKGAKTKQYPWTEFSDFYPYSFTRMDHEPQTAVQRQGLQFEKNFKSATGEKFLLKKKPLMWGLVKRFVVIYSEPENSGLVRDFLKKHLSEQTLGELTDSGFVRMEFK